MAKLSEQRSSIYQFLKASWLNFIQVKLLRRPNLNRISATYSHNDTDDYSPSELDEVALALDDRADSYHEIMLELMKMEAKAAYWGHQFKGLVDEKGAPLLLSTAEDIANDWLTCLHCGERTFYEGEKKVQSCACGSDHFYRGVVH